MLVKKISEISRDPLRTGMSFVWWSVPPQGPQLTTFHLVLTRGRLLQFWNGKSRQTLRLKRVGPMILEKWKIETTSLECMVSFLFLIN